jgi:Tol biopolymer transport system component
MKANARGMNTDEQQRGKDIQLRHSQKAALSISMMAILTSSSIIIAITLAPLFFNSSSAITQNGNNDQIAFVTNRDGGNNYEIYVMNANGSDQQRLTNNTAEDLYPTWSPDIPGSLS